MAILLPELVKQVLPPSFEKCRKPVRDAIMYIRFHYSEKLTLDDIAEKVNLNQSYLCRIFKKETGENIFHYINKLRMERAAELILGGNRYISEIASMVGIDDQFYFTRLFKKHFGTAPTEYHRNCRNDSL
jgi:two-component system response regulator YesN